MSPDVPETDHLTPRQKKGVAALLASKNIPAAAQVVGVTEKTIDRWLALPAFAAELRARQAGILDAAARRLVTGLDQALDTLENVMQTGKYNERRQAATSWMTICLTIREQTDLELRLAELEKAASS